MKRIAVVALLAGLGTWPGVPAANQTTANGLIQSIDVVGRRHAVKVSHSVRRVDGQLPAPLNDLRLRFPKGTRLRLERFPSCRLATLEAKGPAACVPGSRVGAGIVRLQVPFRFPHEFAGTLRVYNGKDGRGRNLMLYMRPQAGPASVLVGTWSGSIRAGPRLRVRVAQIAIPEATRDSIVRLSFTLGARRETSSTSASFVRAPCPGRYDATGFYGDGSVVTSSDRAKCR